MPEKSGFYPKPGMVCRHHKGGVYTVLHVSNEASPSAKFPLTVVYLGANGNVWSRLLDSFVQSFKVIHDGTTKVECYPVPTVDGDGLVSNKPVDVVN